MKILCCAAAILLSAAFVQAQGSNSAFAPDAQLSANDVIEQIKSHVGVKWEEPTVDTFKAGDPQTRVAGIAVTMMATLDVLQRAAANRQNLIITHEPTFFDHLDQATGLPQHEDDAVLKAKRASALEMPDVQVLIVGETREWETVEYVTDAYTEGRAKALIALGHIPAEQAGMEECARWLKTFITQVPVEFVPAADMWAPPMPLSGNR
jgi:putative NIF3 family GTP cyclohydrolase 1 type 2